MKAWWVYLIRCKDGSLYTGIAVDVAKRFLEHREGGKRSAKYLRGRGPLMLAFKKKIGEKSLALKVEIRIKRLGKAGKEALLEDNSLLQNIVHRVKSGCKNSG